MSRHQIISALALLLFLWTHADGAEVRIINLRTKDLAYDAFTQRIYASVPSSAGTIGNTITVIDPLTGLVGNSVFIGSEPGKLALSDDGQFLYVALDGAVAVRRFNMAAQTAGLQFTLGSDSFHGSNFAEDMAVQPGNPGVVAVSKKNQGISPRHAGVAIYDNGVQRPNVTQRHTGSNVIEFSESSDRLYGYNNESTEFGFRRMSVDNAGVAVIDVAGNIISGFAADIKYEAGLIFSTSGRVVDPEAGTLLGSFSFPGFNFPSAVMPNAATGRVHFVAGNTLLTYDWETLTLLDSVSIPGMIGNATSLVRWGQDGLAFRTTGDQVILFRPTGSVPTADLSVSMTGTPNAGVGKPIVYNIRVTNNGPHRATDVTLTELLNLGDIPAGSSALVTVLVTPSWAGSILSSIAVNSNEPDANTADNVAAINTSGANEFSAPDLAGSWVSMTQTCSGRNRPTCTLKGTFDVTNRGSITAPQSLLRFFVSLDGHLAITDSVFSQGVVNALSPNQTQRVSLSVRLPRGSSVHGLHMIGFLDALGLIEEIDEGNNAIGFGPIK